MNILIEQGKLEEYSGEAIVFSLFEDTVEPEGVVDVADKASGELIRDILATGDFKGKFNSTSLIYTRGALPSKRILLIGAGKKEKFDLDKVRQISAKAVRSLRDAGLKSYATMVHGASLRNFSLQDLGQTITEGTMLGLYRFDRYRTGNNNEKKEIEEVKVIDRDEATVSEVSKGRTIGEAVAHGVFLARDLASTPGNDMTPTILAERAVEMAKARRLSYKVIDREEMEKMKMGALLGVARGSVEPPKFIVLEHNATRTDLPTLVLVGKGVTFDSGGISIKSAERMHEMKYDMCGGAAVIGAMNVVGTLNLPLRVIGLVPATENLPSGTAFKPGDVLTSLSGKTIEILNTDAEGRLILSDALAYAKQYNPKGVIDLATLTGACVVALGNEASGMMGNNRQLIERVQQAGEASGERVWELPLWEEYHEQIKSDVADMKNTGGRPAGAITAAALLSKFAEDYPWVHLDIAGTAWSDRDRPYIPKGPTGVGVRLLVHLLRNWGGES